MSKLYITEFQVMGHDGRSVIDAPSSPSVTVQTVNIGSASAQSAAFNSLTRFIRVVADSRCAVAFGDNPTALAASSTRLMPNEPTFFAVTPGHKIAVIDASKRSYACAFSVTPAASTTDLVEIIGAANKIITVDRIEIQGVASASLSFATNIIKRSALNTGGSSSNQTIVPLDSSLGASAATVKAYTANPAVLGAAVGNVWTTRLTFLAATAATYRNPSLMDFSECTGGLFLNSATETLCVNFNGTPTTFTTLDFSIYLTEEDV